MTAASPALRRTGTLLALGACLLLTGCPKGKSTLGSSGEPQATEPCPEVSAEPAPDASFSRSERAALRGRLERSRALLRSTDPSEDGGAEGVLTAALAWMDADESGEDRGQAASQLLDALAAATWVAPAELPTEALGEALPPSVAEALRLREEGEAEGALAEGIVLLDALERAGLDSLSLRLLLADWALADEDGILAEEQYERVALSGPAVEAWLARGRSQRHVAQALVDGPEAAALAVAQEALDAENWAAAYEALMPLAEEAEDPAIGHRARALLEQLVAHCRELAQDRLARAEVLLSSDGFRDEVLRLLDAVEVLPPDSWDAAELERLRSWLDEEGGARKLEAPEDSPERQLAMARSLVAETRYREALDSYKALDGSRLQSTARAEALKVADTFVKEERERAGRLFVAARKLRDPESQREQILVVREVLAGLLSEFPDSRYAGRVADNLAAVDRELAP